MSNLYLQGKLLALTRLWLALQLLAGPQYARLSSARNRPAWRHASPCDAHVFLRSSPIDPLLSGKVSLGGTKARARQLLRGRYNNDPVLQGPHCKRKRTSPCLANKQLRKPRKNRSRSSWRIPRIPTMPSCFMPSPLISSPRPVISTRTSCRI